MSVLTGAQRLVADPDLIPGKRWGLVTNYTAVLPDFELSAAALARTGRVHAVLSPEHGLRGVAQAGFADDMEVDPDTGLKVVDTYKLSGQALQDAIAPLGLDALVADIQNIGTRFYTYAWTVVDCMRAAAELGIPFYVLDRPNPITGAAQGPGLVPACSSFVGRCNVPLRHGMTLGELARQVAAMDTAAGTHVPEPTVIAMQGWARDMWWEQTGLPWVMPSPNLPTVDTALVYPGTGLFEGTNMSEGRGTTRPFELIGAPWLDSRYAAVLNERGLPGARFRSAWFSPTFSKCAGETLGGAQVYVTDRDIFDPVLTGVTMLSVAKELGQGNFEWRMPTWESTTQVPFIDLLWGSDTLRLGLDEAMVPDEVVARSPKPVQSLVEPLYPL